MSVDQATLDTVRTMATTVNAEDLAPLATFPEVLAYVITQARATGTDEADMVELTVRSAEMPPDDVRAAERVLRPLGHTVAADRLKLIAGRRKNALAPLIS
jgi:hypothetical protein